jgi:[ribosomal protein S18]-alanine N-acetyltransferase
LVSLKLFLSEPQNHTITEVSPKKGVVLTVQVFNPQQLPTPQEKSEIINFLFQHLEQYGDPKHDIEKCLDYALKISESFGGFALKSADNGVITGVVIVNKTGMNGYIPDNILVYIATHHDYRGKGLGKLLIDKVFELAEGDIALHVEPDNPARFLYENKGFTNKYLEMRWKQPN